jgi:hypothetical protein
MDKRLNYLVENLPNPSKYIIDIGASSGVPTDPTFQFITNKNYKGLCIEGNSKHIDSLRNNISNTFDIYNGYVTPNNILQIFSDYNVPLSIDLLKIDIDGYDLEVIRKILSVYRPKLIIAEINEKIPPPILFEVKYKKTYEWDYSHCFGFSVASGYKAMIENNYNILGLYEMNNVLCIEKSLCENMGLTFYKNINNLYNDGYVNNPKRLKTFPWNDDVNYWLNISDKYQLKNEIENYFCNKNTRSQFKIKTKKKDEDFFIGLLN